MKKKLTKKENAELYDSFRKRVDEIKRRNRKLIIETELIPLVIRQKYQLDKVVLKPEEAKKKAIEIFEMAVEKELLDEFYHKKIQK